MLFLLSFFGCCFFFCFLTYRCVDNPVSAQCLVLTQHVFMLILFLSSALFASVVVTFRCVYNYICICFAACPMMMVAICASHSCEKFLFVRIQFGSVQFTDICSLFIVYYLHLSPAFQVLFHLFHLCFRISCCCLHAMCTQQH